MCNRNRRLIVLRQTINWTLGSILIVGQLSKKFPKSRNQRKSRTSLVSKEKQILRVRMKRAKVCSRWDHHCQNKSPCPKLYKFYTIQGYQIDKS